MTGNVEDIHWKIIEYEKRTCYSTRKKEIKIYDSRN